MSMTKVLPCACANEYQDSKYGSGKRVFNQTKGSGNQPSWRCSVCKAEKASDK